MLIVTVAINAAPTIRRQRLAQRKIVLMIVMKTFRLISPFPSGPSTQT
jgi:hypothetical protein